MEMECTYFLSFVYVIENLYKVPSVFDVFTSSSIKPDEA